MTASRAAVIGSPVSHSLSPAIHNAVFARWGRDCHYEAIDTSVAAVGEMVELAKRENFVGLSVTMPLKERVMEHLDDVTDDARTLKAVNCVSIIAGRAIGHNTDGFGCAEAMRRQLGLKELSGKKIVLLGAGGTARAMALELCRDGASVRVINRTPERAESLVTMVNSAVGPARCALGDSSSIADADIVINATSVGMNADPSGREVGEHLPCDVSRMSARHVVMDAVYQPLQTAFLRAAGERGARTIDGLWMLIWQAVQQQALWFDRSSIDFSAMADTMRVAAEQELARRRQ